MSGRKNIRVLAVMPPMVQVNTPYPSTACLTGFLRSRGVAAAQADLALELVLELFSRSGLERVRRGRPKKSTEAVRSFRKQFDRYADTVDAAVAFLQGKNPTLAHRICTRRFLPEGPRFRNLDAFVAEDNGDPLAWAFGALGAQDRAKHLATLYLNDLADAIRDAVDPRFEFARYGELLARSQPTFDPLARALAAKPTLVDEILRARVRAALATHRPDLVLVSVPFPGCVYGAFRIAQAIKEIDPRIATALGGGFVNTELRELSEPRVFDFFDYVTLDDGERPVLALVEHLRGGRPLDRLVRTFARRRGQVRFIDSGEKDVPFAETGAPTWDGLAGQGARGPHRSGHRRNRPDRLPLHGRGRAAGGAEGAGSRIEAAQSRDFVVGQHPVREGLYAGVVPGIGGERLHRGLGRPGSGLGPVAEVDGQRRDGGAGRAGGQGVCRRGHSRACLPDVRLPEPNCSGDGGRAGNGAAIV